MSARAAAAHHYWPAPTADGPVHATVVLPGSKSQTSRAFVIGTIAQHPTVVEGALASRDTYLAARAMMQFGADIVFSDGGNTLTIRPPKHLKGGGTIDCGLAGTVMRFGPALAAFAEGKTTFVGDPAAELRPIGPLMDSLTSLGAKVTYRGRRGFLPVTIEGIPSRRTKGKMRRRDQDLGDTVRIDTSSSSQYLSALLLASPLIPDKRVLRADGRLPSWPYVAMSIDMLAEQGVRVKRKSSWSWQTDPIRPLGLPISIEPDLSNAGPFLAAALLTGGSVTIADWPDRTDQVGKYWMELLPQFGASVALTSRGLTVTAPRGLQWKGIDFDLASCGELAPTVAALCLFATTPSTLIGIGHLRGHETDRLEAIVKEIKRLGGSAREMHDGLLIVPKPLHAAELESYDDHRMATFGAIVGLRVPGCTVANIETTAKTLPDFPRRWEAMLAGESSPEPLTMKQVFEDPALVAGKA